MKEHICSVVIPAYNEAKTIAKVIEEVLKNKEVSDLVVVDDGSTDKTIDKITKFKSDPRFRYIKHSKNKGKGAALKTGIKATKNEILLLLDADLKNITAQKIKKIYMPVMRDEVDLSRASFTLARGRVTELAVKPMMKILFPELDLAQPITGQVCAKKEFLSKINLENRWGVDIGILFDAINEGQRIVEINIGKLDHKDRSMEDKAEMARQVLETMIQKTGLLQHKYKLIVFTFDRTLIQEKTLIWVYEKLGIKSEMAALQAKLEAGKISYKTFITKVALLYKDKDVQSVCQTLSEAPLVPYAKEVISTLKKRRFKVAIISSNISPIVVPIAKELGIDLIDCNYVAQKNGRFTGKVTPQSQKKWSSLSMSESFRKSFARTLRVVEAKPIESIMIINNPGWLTVMEKAGLSIAYQPQDKELKLKADKTIHVLAEILALVE